MHILMRRSSFNSTSHALAWHTASFPSGFWNIDRSQNVDGSGSNPMLVKKPSAVCTMRFQSYPFATSAAVTSSPASFGYGVSMGYSAPQSCAHMFPSRCAGILPPAGTRSAPYVSLSFART